MSIAAAGSSPLPPSTQPDLVSTLNQLVQAISQLVQVLQARAGAAAQGGGPGAGAAQLTDPKQAAAAAAGSSSPVQQTAPGGCGCCGAADAVTGTNQPPLPDTAAPPAPPPPSTDQQPPAAPADHGITAKPGTREYNAQVIAKVAREYGVDPVLAVADAIHESGLKSDEHTGDGGSSFGLFQLHVGGELPKDWYPGAANHQKAFDPEANARIALARFRDLKGQYSGGELAFHAQRPANEGAYVKAVEANYDEARKLLAA